MKYTHYFCIIGITIFSTALFTHSTVVVPKKSTVEKEIGMDLAELVAELATLVSDTSQLQKKCIEDMYALVEKEKNDFFAKAKSKSLIRYREILQKGFEEIKIHHEKLHSFYSDLSSAREL